MRNAVVPDRISIEEVKTDLAHGIHNRLRQALGKIEEHAEGFSQIEDGNIPVVLERLGVLFDEAKRQLANFTEISQ